MTNKGEEQLIHEKITVPEPEPRTSRPRLLDLLNESLKTYNATIIHGRAGTGKTTLAADFAYRATRRVCWYKVDAADQELSIFSKYLAGTIRRQRPSLDQMPLIEITESIRSDRAELLADAFVYQLTEHRSDPLAVIVEDLHLVYDAEWVVPFFHRLLSLLPSDVHLIITCRSLPPTPLWRLRSKQMLRIIDEADLAFTFEEALHLFETYGLSEAHAQIALRNTNGRAVAIANFAATPGLAGRAMADSFLSLNPRKLNPLSPRTPDFQT